ncbi:MAG: nucleoside 2-deoxyribosyltransferase [Chloroflexi bacterium]|nr:nucleoside 2-deoxyribosyltransferase [Chloroflexota bacterium]
MKVYLASPLGFATATRAYLHELVTALEGHGLTVYDPWGSNRPKTPSLAPPPELPADYEQRRAVRHAKNHTIGQQNAEAIQNAHGLIAVLDGVDVDSGTAAEIGYAFGLGKAIWGLRTDTRLAGDNEGAIVNLQVQYFIEASGGRIAQSIPDLLLLLDYRELPGGSDVPEPEPSAPEPIPFRPHLVQPSGVSEDDDDDDGEDGGDRGQGR